MCPMQSFRKIIKYLKINTDCLFTLLVLLFGLETFFLKRTKRSIVFR